MIRHPPISPLFPNPTLSRSPVLQFFTRLRRHASLDGASPYFKVKKWKLEPSQRASSLDTRGERRPDRKSTRLNSSHANISYAVFCLKKKNNTMNHTSTQWYY